MLWSLGVGGSCGGRAGLSGLIIALLYSEGDPVTFAFLYTCPSLGLDTIILGFLLFCPVQRSGALEELGLDQ